MLGDNGVIYMAKKDKNDNNDDRTNNEMLSDAKWISDVRAIEKLPRGNKKEQKLMRGTKNVNPQEN